MVPGPNGPMRNSSYQRTGVGEGADTRKPSRQDRATSNPSTSREREEPDGQLGQRPADVLRVGKINITQTGQHEFNTLQGLGERLHPPLS